MHRDPRGGIGTAVYRSEIAVSADAPEQAAAAARDTLGGAVAAGQQLPSSVLQAGTEALTHGLQIATGTAAALAAEVAILAAVMLRERSMAAAPSVRAVALQECWAAALCADHKRRL